MAAAQQERRKTWQEKRSAGKLSRNSRTSAAWRSCTWSSRRKSARPNGAASRCRGIDGLRPARPDGARGTGRAGAFPALRPSRPTASQHGRGAVFRFSPGCLASLRRPHRHLSPRRLGWPGRTAAEHGGFGAFPNRRDCASLRPGSDRRVGFSPAPTEQRPRISQASRLPDRHSGERCPAHPPKEEAAMR